VSVFCLRFKSPWSCFVHVSSLYKNTKRCLTNSHLFLVSLQICLISLACCRALLAFKDISEIRFTISTEKLLNSDKKHTPFTYYISFFGNQLQRHKKRIPIRLNQFKTHTNSVKVSNIHFQRKQHCKKSQVVPSRNHQLARFLAKIQNFPF
jgi:hypothetical protein